MLITDSDSSDNITEDELEGSLPVSGSASGPDTDSITLGVNRTGQAGGDFSFNSPGVIVIADDGQNVPIEVYMEAFKSAGSGSVAGEASGESVQFTINEEGTWSATVTSDDVSTVGGVGMTEGSPTFDTTLMGNDEGLTFEQFQA